MIIPVILSGGAGTRLWPLSRELYPKQFLPLVAERSLLQETALRLRGLPQAQAPLVVCNEEHRFLVAEQLRQVDAGGGHILLEPAARNTAPAVALAALHAQRQGNGDALLLVLPSDHVIADPAALQQAVLAGEPSARDGALVTFGVVPTRAETGYGYIHVGDPLTPGGPAKQVRAFVEKPDATRAAGYLASGEYLWNGGMFLFTAGAYLTELERHAPAILAACRAACDDLQADLDFVRVAREPFLTAPTDSVDYAVMEHTDRAVVVPLDAGWSDVGSWDALLDVQAADAGGNVIRGDVLAEDVSGSLIHSESRLVAALGVRDHVIVETADAVLVADRARAQDVKRLVERLKAQRRDESMVHRQVLRPWGSYEGLVRSERFQVKRIVVRPGASLSLQMHHHRAEHWVVVKGTARVTCADQVRMLSEDQSTYIPIGSVHRLENPGRIDLEIIEVQSGSYLGEDDIVRLEDHYGRSGA
ncbi:mannose-1-phosphate guanylyltransferase/mannose-6-phosphate isomerase [Immundisolibacter sp.]|uniref:mannose-1-phosphate guanylyltransferase/mannose-6-phosphate isomerase n=1 Tax=Immundisolibacter sp. TaxID=1934948 RepID=UPI000EF094A9|nr:mannose-1-phosphate guanylyltransferase/mannose-6-phosphate isomerase [Gammaproteobacteria bacterium]